MSAEPQIANRAPQAYAGLPLTGTMDSFSAAIDAGFPELFGTLGQQGIAPAGPPDHRSWPGRVEYYLTDPSAEPDPAQWQTEVAFLIGD